MSVRINSVEDHKQGQFYVDVNLGGRRNRFSSMMDAQKWLDLMKKSGGLESLVIELREVVIGLKKQMVYESCFAM